MTCALGRSVGGPSAKKFDDLASECLGQTIGNLSNKQSPTHTRYNRIFTAHVRDPRRRQPVAPCEQRYRNRYVHIICNVSNPMFMYCARHRSDKCICVCRRHVAKRAVATRATYSSCLTDRGSYETF